MVIHSPQNYDKGKKKNKLQHAWNLTDWVLDVGALLLLWPPFWLMGWVICAVAFVSGLLILQEVTWQKVILALVLFSLVLLHFFCCGRLDKVSKWVRERRKK